MSSCLSLSIRLPRQAGQAEMSPTSISICIYPAHDPGLFTMLQEPQITPIITRSLTARRSRYQKINMLMYQPGVQSVTAQLYSHATCLARAWGLAHDTHTHTHSSLEESWRAVVSITELVKITLVQMAVQHYQTSQEAAECLQQCSCNSKHSRVLIALLRWEGVVGIKDRKRDTKKKKSDAKQSICDK